MEELIKYIKSAVGAKMSVSRIGEQDVAALPMYITQLYNLYDATIANVPVLLAELVQDATFAPKQYIVHEQILHAFRNRVVVFVFHQLESYNRGRLAEKGINFILIGNRIHIPALWLILEKERKGHRIAQEMTPSAQAVLLYAIYATASRFGYRELTERLSMPYATVCKAIETLTHLQLCMVVGSREKQVCFNDDKPSLLRQALPLLKSPVKHVIYTDKQPPSAIAAGITALAEYTMLNPDEQQHLAISFDAFKRLKNYSPDDRFMPYRIEVWTYNPQLFVTDGLADKISVYLSLQDNTDERIQYELEQMLNQLWS